MAVPMSVRIAVLLLFLRVVAWAAPVEAPHITVDLIAEATAAAPASTTWLAVKFTIEPEWHLYWRNAGDSGEPPNVKWTLPAGWKAGPIAWPRPGRFFLGPLVNYGYQQELVLLVPVEVPAGASGPAQIAADVTWLVCQEQCIPGKAHLQLELPIGAPAKGPQAAVFERTRPKVPPALPAGMKARAERTAGGFRLIIEPPLSGPAYFYPSDGELLQHAADQPGMPFGAGEAIELKAQENLTATPSALTGVLEVGPQAWEIEAPLSGSAPAASASPAASAKSTAAPSPPASGGHGLLGVEMGGVAGQASPSMSAAPGRPSSAPGANPPPPAPPLPPSGDAPSGLLEALLLAFVGGLVLNVMPCVFPVLSIKALEVVQNAGKEHAHIRRNAVLYAVGVIATFWVLAAVLIGLRAGGQRLGWGFHLQSPGFGAVLCGLLFAMSLSLLGVFEVEAPNVDGSPGEGGALGALMTGVLATVVATPCTAPFMGTALGWAATQPAAIALAVFTALGVGLAAPYVAISWVPAVGRWLPRPGRWMETVKQGLAFPLLGTVVWLTWVVGLQTDVDTVALVLAGYLGLAVAGWMHGRWDGRGVRRVAKALGLAMFVMLGVKVRAPADEAPPAAVGAALGETATGAWLPYSPQLLDQLLAANRPVFVDFTAAWCVTCKFNELNALKGATMVRMKELGITALRADWTRRDETIAAALAKFGRDGVPLYVLYPGKGGQPRILPQILTRDAVMAELERVIR